MNKITFLAYFIVLFCIVGCNNSKKQTATSHILQVTDSSEKVVTLKQTAKRVLVLFEPMVDGFFMLGAQDKIVGIPEQLYQNTSAYEFLSKLDNRLKNREISTPTYNGRSVNIETVISLNPDLVIAYHTDTEVIAQLENLGIPTFVVSSNSRGEIYSELKNIALLVDKTERAEQLVNYVESQLNQIPKTENENISVYYAWSKGRIFSTSGKGTLIDDAIKASGLSNACPLEMNALNIGAETLYQWNPNMIVLWNSAESDVYDLEELSALPAVKKRQVHTFTPAFYYDPHTLKFMLFAKQLRFWATKNTTSTEFLTEIESDLNFLYGIKP